MKRRNRVFLVGFVLVASVAVVPALALGGPVTGNPEVLILAPQANQMVSSLGIRLEVSVSNFTLDGDAIGGPPEPNHGHYHVYFNTTFTGLQLTDRIFDISDLPLGSLQLGVQLVNNNHASLLPQVWHNITVTVVAPSVTFVHPTADGIVSTEGARFQLDIQGFELDAENYGGEPIPGHGHYHAFADLGTPNVTFLGTPTEPFFDVSALTPGPHNITVDLRTNDHFNLMPDVNATIMVTAKEPSITIMTPGEGGPVSTLGAQFTVAIAGWELDGENYGGNPIPGHGHYHVFVDGVFTFITPTEPSFTIPSFAPGDHTIFVDLRTNNHVPLDPSVNDTINITAVAPAIAIVTPADGSTVSTRGAQFTVAIAGWELDGENYGGNPIPGHGHYHVFVDGVFAFITPTEPSFTIPSFAPGDHTIFVDLRTNNHVPLDPVAEHTITVTAVEPSISIVSPAANAMVSTLGAEFTVAIAGWELDGENYGGNPIPGHGHYHVFVDGVFAFITPTVTNFTIDSFTAGSHTIFVDLRNNNHVPLDPSVNDTITVTAAAPSISISEPADGATVGTTMALRVAIGGFVFDPEAIGLAPVAGRGHYHVTVDGTTIDFAVTGTVYAISDLAVGAHTIEVSLHNNDHSALSPAVSDQVTVTVAPAGVDPVVFVGTTVTLLVALTAVAVALFLWGRKAQRGT